MKNSIYFLIFFLLSFSTVIGCDCLEPGSVKTELKRASAVMLAKVLSHDTVPTDTTISFMAGHGYWRFKVLLKEKYTGSFSSDTITIMTPIDERSCGIQFKIGQDYIIYGSAWTKSKKTGKPIKLLENVFWTSNCSRTKEFDKFEHDEIKKTLRR